MSVTGFCPEPGTPRNIKMNTERLVLIFLGMFFVTYIPRLLPLLALSQVRLPERLMGWLSYLPAAILSALIFPGALMRGGVLDPGIGNPSVWALAASFAVAIRTRNLIMTMVAGGVVMFIGQIIL
jgi:branched-subunit amino acid transport protein